MTVSDPYAELAVKNEKYVKNCSEMFLAGRQISKIGNFERFTSLEVLWINDNQIEKIENLDNCIRIKRLYAQDNKIRTVEGSLARFTFLNDLRLSNNRIQDLQTTLKYLSKLVHLEHLDLYGNPLAEEPDYRLHVIASIPSLHVFDRHVVTDEERVAAAKVKASPQRKSATRSQTIVGAPPSAISATVRVLLNDVQRIEKERREKENAEIEALFQYQEQQSEDEVTERHDRGKAWVCSDSKTDSNQEWDFCRLRKLCKDFDHKKTGRVKIKDFLDILEEMKDFGKVLAPVTDLKNEDTAQVNNRVVSDEIMKFANLHDGNIPYMTFAEPTVTLICSASNDQPDNRVLLRWTALSKEEARKRGEDLFERSATLQKRAVVLPDNDQGKPDLIRKAHELSQKACFLHTVYENYLTDSKNPTSSMPSSIQTNNKLNRNDSLHIFSYTTCRNDLTTPSTDTSIGNANDKISCKYGIQRDDYQKFTKNKTARNPVVMEKKTFFL